MPAPLSDLLGIARDATRVAKNAPWNERAASQRKGALDTLLDLISQKPTNPLHPDRERILDALAMSAPVGSTRNVAKGIEAWHGTPKGGFSRFAPSERGIWFTDKRPVAEGYKYQRGLWLSPGENPRLIRARLEMDNPLELDVGGARNNNIPVPWQEYRPTSWGRVPPNAVSAEAALLRAREMGHDGIILRNILDTADPTERIRSTAYGMFDPDRIKILEMLGLGGLAAAPTAYRKATER